MASRKRYTDDQIEAAIRKGEGFMSFAARLLGINRTHLYERVRKSDRLRAVLDEVREATLDTAELALRNQVLSGNIAAIIFTLKTLGKSRGFVERQEVEPVGGQVTKVQIVEEVVAADGQPAAA